MKRISPFIIYHLSFIILAIASLCACKRSAPVGEPQKAAVYYVEQLGKGNYDAWLNGMQSLDHASADYRNHQQTLLKQLMARHKGRLKKVEATDCEIHGDTVADVYLRLTWEGDSTETTLLPLLRDGSRWRLY